MTYKLTLLSSYSVYGVDLVFDFNIVRTVTSGRSRNLTTISNQSPQAARHFAFQPGEQNPKLKFRLYNNGEDKSYDPETDTHTYEASGINDSRITSTDGNGNTIVQTVEEQIIWLDEYVTDNTSDPRWILEGGRWDQSDGNGTNVVIQNNDFEQAAGITTVDGTIDLKLGVTV